MTFSLVFVIILAFVEAMKKHQKVLESYEDGKASERVAKIVGKTCGLEKEY